jgi:NAD(P)-dependent dehydrogenase (short-subunit alcohol dehydrogenase family)
MFILTFCTRKPSILQRTVIRNRPAFRHITTKTAMETIKSTIAENFGGPAHSLAKPEHQFSLEETPDQTGKVAVVTGGSEGIGYGASFTLLQKNLAKLFLISVSRETADGAIADVSEKLGNEAANKITWLPCDLSDWKAAAATSQKIREQTERLDILILNAGRGIMTYQLTEDTGVDRHMALNHMGHVVLTSHLLPLLKSSASASSPVRIAIQASNAHQGAPSDTKFASLAELNRDLGPNPQYGRSKLANILYARYLARHLTAVHPHILANATHPGFVETKMSTEDIHEPFPVSGAVMSTLVNPFKKDQWMGAVSIVFAATKVMESGLYICPPAVPEEGSKMAQDEELGEQLMKLTRELVMEKTFQDSKEKGCPFEFY